MLELDGKLLFAMLAIGLLIGIGSPTYAQPGPSDHLPEVEHLAAVDSEMEAAALEPQAVEPKEKPVKSYQYKTIPYLNYGRNFGSMAGIIPMLMFKPDSNDTVSQPSLAGAYGVYTSNDTWSAGGFAMLFLNEDKWRVTIAAVTGK